jgi:acyl-CoA thioesterase FadM
MFYCWFRLGTILVGQSLKPPIDIRDELSLSFRVRILDCDGLRVMSAFQYPNYLYLASWGHVTRMGLLKTSIRKRWAPVVGSYKFIFRKPLKIWSTFIVKICFAGWDDTWFYQQVLFEQNQNVKAMGFTKLAIWKNNHTLSLDRCFEETRFEGAHNPPPKWILDLFAEDKINIPHFSRNQT